MFIDPHQIRANAEAVLDEVRRTGMLPRAAALSPRRKNEVERLAAVDRRQKVAGFGVPALVPAEPGEARGRAQFPELGLQLLGDAQGFVIQFRIGFGMPLSTIDVRQTTTR